jgi:hypothetical protein
MGALYSFGGYLYFGTMIVPGVTELAHERYFGAPTNSAQRRLQRQNCQRALTIFRGRDFKENPHYSTLFSPLFPHNMSLLATGKVELLYGETNLTSRSMTNPYLWTTNENAMGVSPKYGPSGFGERNNYYTWTMKVYKDKLFVGTLNYTSIGNRGTNSSSGGVLPTNSGAHLWCFVSTNEPARAVSRHGVDNYSSYGIRTMLADSNSLFLGMANPRNLMTDTTNGLPLGGWELVRLTQIFDDKDWDNLPDLWESHYFANATNAVPDDDPDTDYYNNLKEFIAGTDPTNSNDFFSINSATGETNDYSSLGWFGHTGRVYHLKQSTDLTGPWNDAGSITGNNAVVTFTTYITSNNINFFHLQVELGPGPWLGP